MTDFVIDQEVLTEITARMELRKPNRQAVESIINAMFAHYQQQQLEPPLESVVVSATGVGKTYILAASIEYLAKAQGIRDFAIITPGRAILNKTVANFTPGHPKSLLGLMETSPVIVTADNFDTSAMRSALDDPNRVKLYIFTVQSLTRPTTQLGRRTHEFREGLGAAFYEHLQNLDHLIIFADEHHCYYGPAFSSTIRDLVPHALIGLTATPHPKTPDESIIFKYPLAAAVAEKLVKTPIIVGRHDDRTDVMAQLMDGVHLLEIKQQAIMRWCAVQQTQPINPVMLVVAQTIDEANEYTELIESTTFLDGRYIGKVLTVHSNAPDESLEKLDTVEDPNSPVRIIISVGMLKEGWDVKNVYVLASMRASVSDILTEQTLGRGLRLPFGSYTSEEMLDTLEVLAHERYDQLLNRAGIMNEQLRDYRVQLLARQTPTGTTQVTREQWTVTTSFGNNQVREPDNDTQLSWGQRQQKEGDNLTDTPEKQTNQYIHNNGFPVTDSKERIRRGERQLETVREMLPKPNLPVIRIPVEKTTLETQAFSLADITNMEAFRLLGREIVRDPDDTLRRKRIQARIETDESGLRRTSIFVEDAQEIVSSQLSLLPLEELIEELITAVVHSDGVPERESEVNSARRLVQEMVDAMGASASSILSRYMGTTKARLVRLVNHEARQVTRAPIQRNIINTIEFRKVRQTRFDPTDDRYGDFKKGRAYFGWKKSLYDQDWFDSKPERDMANLLDESTEIVVWVRLQTGDLPILWTGQNRHLYNPDFIAVDHNQTHWLIEVKGDKDMQDESVRAKMEAAKRWANHATDSPNVGVKWQYILISEDALRDAHGSWINVKVAAEM